MIDAFGGDNAPLAVIQGSRMAIDNYKVDMVLIGDKDIIEKTASEHNISLDGMEIEDVKLVMPVCADPQLIMTEYAESTLGRGLKKISNAEADAFVSGGSTGAIVMGAALIVKRIKGIKRPALAPVMPCHKENFILLDAGANLEVRPDMLTQFALMGTIYMETIMQRKSPRVGLVNVGEEETKGTQLYVDTYQALKKMKNLNFIGNVEARGIPLGEVDVVVCDGFTGNILLKTVEGMGKLMALSLKEIFSGTSGKLAGVFTLAKIKAIKKKMDYTEYGGAPLLGIRQPVIKAHGSSNAHAFMHAIRQANEFAEKKVINAIETQLEIIKSGEK